MIRDGEGTKGAWCGDNGPLYRPIEVSFVVMKLYEREHGDTEPSKETTSVKNVTPTLRISFDYPIEGKQKYRGIKPTQFHRGYQRSYIPQTVQRPKLKAPSALTPSP